MVQILLTINIVILYVGLDYIEKFVIIKIT